MRPHPRFGACVAAGLLLGLAPALLIVPAARAGPPPSVLPPSVGLHPLLENMSGAVAWSLNLTPVSGVGLSGRLAVSFTLPGGAIDRGSRATADLGVQAPALVLMKFEYLGKSSLVPVPVLGTVGPVSIPGLNFSYLGFSLAVSASITASLRADCRATPPVAGCGPGLTWNGSSDVRVDIDAPSTVGSSVAIALENVSYSLSINLTATGSIPLVGNVSVPIGAPLELSRAPGSPDHLASSLGVVELPTLSAFSANPGQVAVGSGTTLRTEATGGSGPLRYAYTGLPPGCRAANAPTLNCTPSEAGDFSVGVTVSDPQGSSDSGNVVVHVANDWTGELRSTLGNPFFLGALAAALLGLGALALRRRRRRRSPPEAAPSLAPPPPGRENVGRA